MLEKEICLYLCVLPFTNKQHYMHRRLFLYSSNKYKPCCYDSENTIMPLANKSKTFSKYLENSFLI